MTAGVPLSRANIDRILDATQVKVNAEGSDGERVAIIFETLGEHFYHAPSAKCMCGFVYRQPIDQFAVRSHIATEIDAALTKDEQE